MSGSDETWAERFAHESVTRLLAALREGETTALALTGRYLDRIARSGDLAAIVTTDQPRALGSAARADRERNEGAQHPLLGLPIAVKDVIETADLATTYGSAAFRDHRPSADAQCVARLRAAGAIVIGKANTLELAMIEPSPIFGPALNPWDRDRLAGGSSNGSAVAVAAGLCAAALGTDTAGSIRNPASYCGIVGLKPTHGRVSIRGVGCLSSSMDTVGPMTRSVADAALLMGVIAGFDPEDPESRDVAVSDYRAAIRASVERVRIGVPLIEPPVLLAADVEACWCESQDRLAALGATIVPVSLPSFRTVGVLWSQLSGPETLVWNQPRFAERPDLYGEAARAALDRAGAVTAGNYVRARRARHAFARAVLDAMRDCDALLLPTTPTTAPTMEDARRGHVQVGSRNMELMIATTGLTMPFSLTGQPALSVPSGQGADGLPIGMQIVGRHDNEAMLMRIGAALERAAALPGLQLPRQEGPS